MYYSFIALNLNNMDSTIDDELITILKMTALSVEARSQGWEYILSNYFLSYYIFINVVF